MVRRESAKLLYVGSIPTDASRGGRVCPATRDLAQRDKNRYSWVRIPSAPQNRRFDAPNEALAKEGSDHGLIKVENVKIKA